jgi:isovaleryl-CoA dehydrogenase
LIAPSFSAGHSLRDARDARFRFRSCPKARHANDDPRGGGERFADEQINARWPPPRFLIDREDRFPRELWPQSRWARWACTASPWRNNGAGWAWAISTMSSRWRKSAGPRRGRPVLWRALQPVRQPDPPLGQPEQKAKYLPKLISGEHVGSLAMSEAGRDRTWFR